MDPLTTIVTALTAGAASVATAAVKDLYSGLKNLIVHRYGPVDVDVLESDPASASRQQVVREDLEKTAAVRDREVLERAQKLLELVERSNPDAALAVGVSLERLRAARLTVEEVLAEGGGATGVEMTDVDVAGEVSIRNVQARTSPGKPPGEPPKT